MALARAAASRALDDIAAPPPVAAIPGSSAAAIAQAQDEARRRAPDYGKLFTHVSRAVRQTMLLENHIAEDRPAEHSRAAPHASPRHAAATSEPHHETFERDTLALDTLKGETVERLDGALGAYACGSMPVEDLLLTISRSFGLDHGPACQPQGPQAAEPQTLGPAEPNQSNPAPPGTRPTQPSQSSGRPAPASPALDRRPRSSRQSGPPGT